MVKRLLIALVLLLLALAGLGGYYVARFDVNDYRSRIADYLSRMTGREVAIEGEVGLTLYPWLGIRLESVRVAQAPGWGDKPFATASLVKVRIKLRPLLDHRVVLDKVALYRPVVNFHVDKDDRGNWEDLSLDREPRLQAAPEEAGNLLPNGFIRISSVSWGGFTVQDGSFHLRDEVVDETLDITRINLDAEPGLRFDYRLRCLVRSFQLGLEADASLRGECEVNLRDGSMRLLQNLLQAKGVVTIAGTPLQSELSGVVDYDIINGEVDLDFGAFTTPGLGLTMTTKGRRMYWKDMAYTGNATMTSFTPSRWLPPDATENARNVLATLAGETSYRITMYDLALPEFAATLKGVPVSGAFGIPSYDEPEYLFQLAADRVDLDTFFPPGGEGDALPGWLFTDADVDLGLQARELAVRGRHAADVHLALRTGNGTALLGARAGDWAGGRLKGLLSLAGPAEEGGPVLAGLDLDVRNATASDLSLRLLGLEAATGTADLSLSGTAACNASGVVPASLRGRARLELRDGSLAVPELTMQGLSWANATMVPLSGASAGLEVAGPEAWADASAVPFATKLDVRLDGVEKGAAVGLSLLGTAVVDPGAERLRGLKAARTGLRYSGWAGPLWVERSSLQGVADVDLDKGTYLLREASAEARAVPKDPTAGLRAAEARFSGQARLDADNDRLDLSRALLRLDARFRDREHGLDKVEALLEGDTSMDLARKTLVMSRGKAGVDLAFADGPLKRLRGDLASAVGLDLEGRTLSLGGSLLRLVAQPAKPFWGKNRLEAEVAGGVDLDWGAESLRFSGARAKLHGLSIKAEVAVDKLFDAPTVSGLVSLDPFAPRELMREFGEAPLRTKDKGALSRCSLETGFSANATSLRLEGLALKLDQTTLTGSLSVPEFAGPDVRFNLQADSLDVDRYLPPPAAKDAPPSEPPAPAERWNPVPLSGLDLEGSLSVGSLAVNRLTYEGVKAGFQGKDGNVRVGPVEADFYGGRVAGESFVRTQARMAHDTTLAYKGFQVEPVMRNIFKEEEGLESIAGQAFLDLSLSGEGLSWYEQGRALQGSADFSIRKGSYRFFGQGGVKAAAPRDDEPAPGDNGKPNRTEFDEATATLDLKDGIVTNNDFQLKGLLVNAEGKGYADLRNREVDYGLDFRMTGMPTIPIRISGKLEDPSVGVQAGGILPRTLLRIPGSAFGLFRSILSLPFRALDLLGGDKDGEKTQ